MKNDTPTRQINAQSRRQFLYTTGGLAGLTMLLGSCHKDDKNNTVTTTDPNKPGVNADGSINLGTGDIGILNYAYALEQVESAFYTQAVKTAYTGISNTELAVLTNIRDHEVHHREFFKKVLGDNAIPTLDYDFSSINFSDRTIVLTAAKTFEDLGVSAYNGSGRLITDASILATAGKIVSVEARNATYIRYLLGEAFYTGNMNDAAIITNTGQDLSRKPTEVLPIAAKFLKSKIDASHLPTY